MRLRGRPEEPREGDMLTYRLRPEDRPVNVGQQFHGVIKHILVEVYRQSQPKYYIVHSVEHPDCEDELVYPSQVVGYERSSF